MYSPIKPSTSIFRELLFVETLINTTDKVSKVSDESVLKGISKGVAKVSGKAEKDIAIAFSKLFPDTAYGSDLDQCASDHGISARYSSLGSSVWVKLVAEPGTQYLKTIHKISGQDGIVFELEDDFVMGALGFDYVKTRSLTTGFKTNVAPLTLTNVSSAPQGHTAVINEVGAVYGRDEEDDRTFRLRIKEGPNILAKSTPSSIEQAFLKVNQNILKIYYNGVDETGKNVLLITTQNGAALDDSEFDELLTRAGNFMPLTDIPRWGDDIFGVTLRNMEYQTFDLDFRCEILNNANPDEIRQNIQIQVMKYIDHRFFEPSKQKVEWDNLLEIVKNTPGVKYVSDQFFLPRTDIVINRYNLPRLRGFIMRNMNGQLIESFSTLSPIFYPNDQDINFQSTVANFV